MFDAQVNSHCQQNKMSGHLPYLIGREISLFYLSVLSSLHHKKFGLEECYKRRCETQPQGKSNSRSTGHFLEKAAPCPGKACGSSALLPLSVLLGQALLCAAQAEWLTFFGHGFESNCTDVYVKIKWKQSIRRKPPLTTTATESEGRLCSLFWNLHLWVGHSGWCSNKIFARF